MMSTSPSVSCARRLRNERSENGGDHGPHRVYQQIGPQLRDKGLPFTGIDVIGDFMTELNVTSPTGIRELERESDIQITKQMFDAIDSKLE